MPAPRSLRRKVQHRLRNVAPQDVPVRPDAPGKFEYGCTASAPNVENGFVCRRARVIERRFGYYGESAVSSFLEGRPTRAGLIVPIRDLADILVRHVHRPRLH